MGKRSGSGNYTRKHSALSVLKKVGKAIAIILGCLALLFVAWIGIIMYRDTHPKTKPSDAERDPVIHAGAAETVYIDTPVYDELRLYADAPTAPAVTLSDENHAALLAAVGQSHTDFRNAQYYGLEHALALYENTVVDKSTQTSLLTDGKLDPEKLYQNVLRNNAAVSANGKNSLNPFYSELDDANIRFICEEVAEVFNCFSHEIDAQKVANTLERMTVFTRHAVTSNASVTSDIAFLYNPGTVELYEFKLKLERGEAENIGQEIIAHEVMHLIQHGANDGNDDNGVEIGFCRLYNLPNEEKTIPADSLYFTWLLDANAEIRSSDFVDMAPGTYQKRISYVRSYNLSRFYENAAKENMLSDMDLLYTLEEVYDALGIASDFEKDELLNFLYSTEIIQVEPQDFWEYYEAQVGRSLDDVERLDIRMDIRADIIRYLTRSFFSNVANAVHDGAITDLNTVFWLLRLWEIDTFNHLFYTEEGTMDHVEDLLLWYDELQNLLLSAIANSSGLDLQQVQTMYAAYTLQSKAEDGVCSDNCDLTGLSRYMQQYIPAAKENYATTKFSRVCDVAQWLKAR